MKIVAIVIPLILVAGTVGGVFLWTPDKPRAVLEARYLKAPGDMMEIAGTRLHVLEGGPKAGPSVMLMHGFGSSLQTWDPWAEALQRNYRVIRFDLPGCGLSEPDPTGDYGDARTIEILAALMERLGVAKASLIGNSIGGRIAWRFAAEHPERVAKLVLVSPDGFASPGFAYGQKPQVPGLLSLMRYVLPRWLLRQNLQQAYADPARLSNATVDRYYDLMLAPGARDAMLARMRQTVLVDPRPLLRGIHAPVLLIWGEKDAMIPFSNASDYLRDLPNAKLVSFPGLGHVPQEEAPAISLAPVADFLAQ